jgi:hypothetical protein
MMVVVVEFVASNKGMMVVDSLGASVRHARGQRGSGWRSNDDDDDDRRQCCCYYCCLNERRWVSRKVLDAK